MPNVNSDQNQPKQQKQPSSLSSSPNHAQSQSALQPTQSSIVYNTRFPWGAIKEKLPTANITELANI